MENNTTISGRRLYKSRHNRIIDGICGGIAEYFDVDPTVVRILWVLVCLLGGSGLILYIVAMIVMPVNPDHVAQPSSPAPGAGGSERKRYWGIVLILVGVFVLMTNLGWFADLGALWSFSRTVVFPVSLILVGVLFIYVHTRRSQIGPLPAEAQEGTGQQVHSAAQAVKELRRSVTERKICGVCGGLASYFKIDPTLVRILFVVMILASVGWGLLLYIILCIVVPEERLTSSTAQVSI
jgi:phage shock protein PspC (stress-responsive transcriptional regulator)